MARPAISLPKASRLSAGLCNASILLYTLWLLLPAVQTTGGAAAGVFTVGLFGVGVLLDTAYLKAQWLDFVLRAACAALLPLILWFLLHRGGSSFWGYYAQQGMFWFPLLYCAYAARRGDPRLWRYVKPVLLFTMAITTLTTLGWLIEGMTRDGRVYAYSRSLGSGEPGREAYLKELMLRNIGGYDFIYASMLSLPVTCYAIFKSKGWKRAGFIAFCVAQLCMIALSQYTYALVFSVVLMGMELVAGFLRWFARRLHRPLGVLPSLLWTIPLFAGIYLLRVPLTSWAAAFCEGLGLSNFAYSLSQLQNVLVGNAADSASRLEYYRLPWQGIQASPLIGALPGATAPLSQHSDLLDLLSALGILGAAAFLAMVWFMGRGVLKGLKDSQAKPHLLLQYAALLVFSVLGTIIYSRDISLVLCLGALLILHAGSKDVTESEPA